MPQHTHLRLTRYLFFIALLISSGICFAADPLAQTVKPMIADLFGTNSTITYCIYVAEVIIGAVSYVKTKNLMLLIGVPILMLFTHAMFGYIGG